MVSCTLTCFERPGPCGVPLPRTLVWEQVGILMVGLASVLSGEGSQTHVVSTGEMLTGMGLIVASQARTTACS